MSLPRRHLRQKLSRLHPVQNREIIFQLLNKKCEAISVKRKDASHDFAGLVAFRDDLCFPLSESLSDTGSLFNLAHKAISARFDFAKEAHRLARGSSEDYCTEFMLIPVMDDKTNLPTSDVCLVAQYVLRELSPVTAAP